MKRIYTPMEMVVTAVLGIALGIALSLAIGGMTTNTNVVVPKGAISVHVDAPAASTTNTNPVPPAATVVPQPPTQADNPYDGITQYGYPDPVSLHACDLASGVYTSDGTFVPVSPEENVGNNSVSCNLVSADYEYAAIIDVMSNANVSDFVGSLQGEEDHPQLPSGMTMGGITYPYQGIAASNSSQAYLFGGHLSSGQSYQTVTFMASDSFGGSYLITVTLETSDTLPQGDIGQLATDIATNVANS